MCVRVCARSSFFVCVRSKETRVNGVPRISVRMMKIGIYACLSLSVSALVPNVFMHMFACRGVGIPHPYL